MNTSPDETTTPTPVNPPKRSGRALRWLLFLALLAAAAVGGYFRYHDLGAKEQAAVARLKAMGAICTLKSKTPIASLLGGEKHVSSVNFTLLKTPEDFSEGIELMRDLPWVESINMSKTPLSDEDMVVISQAKNAVSLTLSDTAVSDVGFEELAGLRKLESLQASGTQITSKSIPIIARLGKLRILELSATGIAGGLEPLAELPQLEWLLLSELNIDDDSVAALANSKSLKKLSIMGTKFADADLLKKISAGGIAIER